ncbi:MAG TPA: MBL fold metallo-hydrolase [Chloroflexota bacterium]|jgi:glyoxylase-like metal-dependent hydrolase (beta-lactamase superfamily II)|nr:MBL fold metallo-hydrolase [Chloroflexota bacterium]
MSDIELRQATVGDYDNNVYVLVDRATNESILIDAPFEPDTIEGLTNGTTVKYILLTHGDYDHIQALPEMERRLGAPVAIHPADAHNLSKAPNRSIEDGDVFTFGESSVRAVHTPGHTPGSISLVAGDILISGDTLFPGGPGNTKREGGDFGAVIASVGRLFELPDGTTVHPGHGKSTTIGAEKPHLQEWIDRGW